MEKEKNKETKTTTKEIKMDDKIALTSIAPWYTGFKRILTVGEVSIAPNGTVRISREEVLAQGQSNNKLITGIDGLGSHATLYIEDDWTRKELGFDTDDGNQFVVTKKVIKDMFEIKRLDSFKKAVQENIVTRAEKFSLLNTIKALKLNDYDKISFCEE